MDWNRPLPQRKVASMTLPRQGEESGPGFLDYVLIVGRRMIMRALAVAVVPASLLVLTMPAVSVAQGKSYGPGVSDDEIRLGQTMPYSGALSAFSTTGRTIAAYFRMVNENGGINGRKLTLLSLDNGSTPPKTVEQTRRLVEQENVLAIEGSLGAAHNAAVQRYLNDRKVPQLFIFTGAARFNDPQNFPWTMTLVQSETSEARAYGRHILATVPHAKVGVLYQRDDAGRGWLAGLKQGLGAKAERLIVREESFEFSDPTIDSQIVALQGAGADVVFYATGNSKFAAQAIRKAYDIGWRPLQFLPSPASSVVATLAPAGLDKSIGVVTAEFVKVPGDPSWAEDPEIADYLAFIKRYYPEADPSDRMNVLGYYNAAATVYVLKQCGEVLTRANLMFQATHMIDVRIPMLLPSITLSTSPTDYAAIKQLQLQRFDGTRWARFGSIIDISD
jgi:branched-chain amino acid transport system substrate-binding protein